MIYNTLQDLLKFSSIHEWYECYFCYGFSVWFEGSFFFSLFFQFIGSGQQSFAKSALVRPVIHHVCISPFPLNKETKCIMLYNWL